MAFERILSRLLSHRGMEAVTLLDAEGETIFSLGKTEAEKLKLIGAYQGIILSAVRRSILCSQNTVITLGEEKSIVTHHLVDGYYLSVILAAEAHYACVRDYLQGFYELLERELL